MVDLVLAIEREEWDPRVELPRHLVVHLLKTRLVRPVWLRIGVKLGHQHRSGPTNSKQPQYFEKAMHSVISELWRGTRDNFAHRLEPSLPSLAKRCKC